MASNLTAVVVLEREAVDLGIDSDEAQDWSAVGTFRAEVRPLRFTEAEREGATRELQGYLFRIYTSQARAMSMTAADRLVWNGRTLNIREVRDPDPRARFTEIIAESGVTQ